MNDCGVTTPRLLLLLLFGGPFADARTSCMHLHIFLLTLCMHLHFFVVAYFAILHASEVAGTMRCQQRHMWTVKARLALV